MTPEEQRIAIAESCPTLFKHGGNTVYWHTCNQHAHQAVDLLNDLNAMHEAVQTLRGIQVLNFLYNLFLIVSPGSDWDSAPAGVFFAYINATAAQRAEAFLKTIGKWTDS